jgi:hypothetical protein
VAAETREKRIRRLARARRAARWWTLLGAGFGGAAAVLIPYAGIGAPDAIWAAAAGGSIVMAVFRWHDLRTLSRLPLPPPDQPAAPGGPISAAMRMALAANPVARAAVDEVGRRAGRRRFRGSAAAAAWDRLDTAATTLAELDGRLGEQVGDALAEAVVGERSLRDLAGRVTTVERALRFARDDTRGPLEQARRELLARLDDGVATYERLVAAAASCAAHDGVAGDPIAALRLRDAADKMAGFAAALAELRDLGTPTTSMP